MQGSDGEPGQGVQRLGVLRREVALQLVDRFEGAQTLAGGVEQRHAKQAACLEAGGRIDLGIPRRVGLDIIHLADLPGLDDLADDPRFGHAQLAAGDAEGGPADQLAAGLVPEEDAGSLAAEQVGGLAGDVLQQRDRLTLLGQLLRDGQQRLQAFPGSALAVPGGGPLQGGSQVMPGSDGVFQLGLTERLARPGGQQHPVGTFGVTEASGQEGGRPAGRRSGGAGLAIKDLGQQRPRQAVAGRPEAAPDVLPAHLPVRRGLKDGRPVGTEGAGDLLKQGTGQVVAPLPDQGDLQQALEEPQGERIGVGIELQQWAIGRPQPEGVGHRPRSGEG